MSMSRCLIRRYKDATAPIWRAQEIVALIDYYRQSLHSKSRQIESISSMLRDLESEAGRESLYGCRDCDEACSGLCFITYCTDKRLVASHEALVKTQNALCVQRVAICKKLDAAKRVEQALHSNNPILALKEAA